MNVHHRQLSDLIKLYAQPTQENDDRVRAFVRTCRIEVMSGITVTMPGMPSAKITDLEAFDKWRVGRFPRLYAPTE
ncbi:MAG: hypothetical protein ACJAZO_003975 [Myxococcota bacterium]|jgi:hypothetical protein